jgi:sugar transferase (PEP-CTERM/EpsH1 system associated)
MEAAPSSCDQLAGPQAGKGDTVNVLFIVHRIPYPPNKGDKIRSFNEIKYLAQKHNIYLAFLVDDEKDLSHLDELRKYCVDFNFDVIKPQWQKFKSVPYLLTKKPLSVPYFYSKKLQAAIDKRLDEAKIDAVICFSSPMAEYIFRSKTLDVRDVQNVRIEQVKRFNMSNKRSDRTSESNIPRLIMDFVDVDSDKWRMYAGFSKFPLSTIYRREWKTLMSYEQKIGRAFDRSIFVSDKEVELFESFCPQARNLAFAIPNGVDYEYFNPGEHSQSNKLNQHNHPSILFMGAMDYFPNEDAVLYFSREVWPLVKKAMPDAKFVVVGGKPSKGVMALSKMDKGIMVTGFVSDVREYLKTAEVFVAPLRIARGVQNKILEALAAGVPVVARPEAVQGLGNCTGCVKIEGNSEMFALSILKFLRKSRERQQIVTDARRFLVEHHDWEKNLTRWDKLLTLP